MLRVRTLAILLALMAAADLAVLLLTPTPRSSASPLRQPAPLRPDLLTSWIINTDGHLNPHWTSPVDVQSVQQVSINGVPYAAVRTNRIPDYYTTITSDLVQELNGRQHASTDFRLGHTTATVGQVVRFGDDIGYSYRPCTLGYWAPGPTCPTAQSLTVNFPMQPLPATTATATSLGNIGLMVNGAGIFNWSDGMSYNNGHVWQNTALSFELYDMDICPGHAANGDYHHHSYPDCMAQLLGDNGSAHSPIYGFALDGYPIYGPWIAPGVLAQSGWRTRDYDDPASPTGCGTAHVRSCTLVDPLDPTRGTVPSSQVGPRTDTTLTTMSGNVISSTSGIYLQDYWYDRSCTTCLDQYNGTDDHDGLGYHYVMTVRAPTSGSRMVPVFPYIVGPNYAGQLAPASTYTPTPVGGSTATSTPTHAPSATPGAATSTAQATAQASSTPTSPAASPTSPVASPTSQGTPAASATAPVATVTQPAATSTLAAATGTAAAATPTTCTINFSDVHTNEYFYNAVRYLYCAGVVTGYGDGTFQPYNNASRGQVSKIVVLAFAYPIYTPQSPTFPDVAPGSTFYPYVETAAHNHIVSGFGDGTFRTASNITRGQLAKVVDGAAGWALVTPPTPHFSDVPADQPFYSYVETAYAHGVISGYSDGTYGPGNPATRGQISKIVYGALQTR